MFKESVVKNIMLETIPYYLEEEGKREGITKPFFYNKRNQIPRNVLLDKPFIIQGGRDGEVTLKVTWNDPNFIIKFDGEDHEYSLPYEPSKAFWDDSYEMSLTNKYIDTISSILDDFIIRCVQSEKTKPLFKTNTQRVGYSRKERKMRALKRNLLVKEMSGDGDHYDDYADYQKDSSRKAKSKKLYKELVDLVGEKFVDRAVMKYCDETDLSDIADTIGYGEDDERSDIGEAFCTNGDTEYQVGVIGKNRMYDLISEIGEDRAWEDFSRKGNKLFSGIKGVADGESMDGTSDPFDFSGVDYTATFDDSLSERLGLEPWAGTSLLIEDGKAKLSVWDQNGPSKEEEISLPNMGYASAMKAIDYLAEFTKKVIKDARESMIRSLRRKK